MKKYKRLQEAISVMDIKRGSVRKKGQRASFDNEAKRYGLKQDDLIGWFANKYNYASGWAIFKASPHDKAEFGKDVFRTYSSKSDTTSIIKFNLKTGVYAFVDNDYYDQTDQVKFQKPSTYDRIIIEDTPKAFQEFGITG